MAVRPKKTNAREELETVFVRTLLDTANSLIICLDKEANLLIFNAECERVTGYKNHEVIGKSWPGLFLPDDHYHHRVGNFAEWVRKHPRDTLEGTVRTKGGEIRTILWSNSAIFYPNSDELMAIAVGQDITERKRAEEALKDAFDHMEKRVQERTAELLAANQRLKEQFESRIKAEEALRESERRYEMATSSGKVGVWDWNLETNDIYVDPNMKAALGYKDCEIRNHLDDWGKLVHPDDAEKVMIEANRHIDGLAPQFEVVHRMFHKDGSIRWILARGTIVRDETGTPTRMLGTDSDITERKLAEEALEESEDRFRKLSEVAEEGIIIYDNGIIIDANEAFARMFGYELSELIGTRAEKLATLESWKVIMKRIADRDETPYDGMGVRKDGSTFPCHLAGKQYEYRGKTLRVATFMDLTNIKQTEAKLKNTADELEAERRALKRKNIALKEILGHIERERTGYQQRLCRDLEQAIKPIIKKLRRISSAARPKQLEALESDLRDILARDGEFFQDPYERLSPREVEICKMISEGMSSKEICARLSLALVTIHKHREQIRKKLGITNKKINLSTYLRSHEQKLEYVLDT